MDAASNVSALIVFAQGVLSFFSPCVLPLIPLYVGYLMGGARDVDDEGNAVYPRSTVFLNTVGFVVGISFAFAVLGAGFSALGRLLSDARGVFSVLAGVVMILFGLYMLGVFGKRLAIEQERRLPFRLDRWAMSPLTAFVLGFTFSFAWTPCVGPVLASVLLMASTASTAAGGFALVGLYALGFCLPFLAVGLFTGQVLTLIKRHRGIVQAATKIGAVLLIVMGVATMTGLVNGASSVLAQAGSGVDLSQAADGAASGAGEGEGSSGEEVSGSSTAGAGAETGGATSSAASVPAVSLSDLDGTAHSLEDYRGRVVVLDFFTTWCTYCKQTLPDLQAIYEETGRNQEDVVVLGVANPRTQENPDNVDVSEGMVASFLGNLGVEYPTFVDETGDVLSAYQVSGFPTTVIVGKDGKLVKYVPGAVSKTQMESYIEAARKIS